MHLSIRLEVDHKSSINLLISASYPFGMQPDYQLLEYQVTMLGTFQTHMQ
jgi:hypothetical protein